VLCANLGYINSIIIIIIIIIISLQTIRENLMETVDGILHGCQEQRQTVVIGNGLLQSTVTGFLKPAIVKLNKR